VLATASHAVRFAHGVSDGEGLTVEDSSGPAKAPLFDFAHATARVGAARAAGTATGVPIAINARVDVLAGGGEWSDMVARANSYLAAGADCVFVLGLSDEEKIEKALAEIDGPISVIGGPRYVSLKRLGEYPQELGFSY